MIWYLYTSIAIGGVLLMAAPPKDVEDKRTASAVAFTLTWPIYLMLYIAQQCLRRRQK